MNTQKFFLYARKSTDVEDKQVLSIEAQLDELREYATREGLDIAREFVEKKSAKIPGRVIFNEMLERIEAGDATAILAWHPDRLARNSIDGGKIIYLLDTRKIMALKFPSFWCEPTPQGKFMLNMAFGQSKYYVDSLSENVKRGLRQKLRRGEYPSLAPVGYIHNQLDKTLSVDTRYGPVIRQAFELYARGDYTLGRIGSMLEENHLLSKRGQRIHISRATFILSNPFYYGHFRYSGELYEGKYEPIVSKQLFDAVQVVMKQRGRPRRKSKTDPQAYCGLMSCATCNMMITGEYRIKRQVSGKEHYYTYYHCSKKSKVMPCPEPCIRQEALDAQISSLIQNAALPTTWAAYLFSRLETDTRESKHTLAAFVSEAHAKTEAIKLKLERLLNAYLEQDIERDVYCTEKAKLMSEKRSLEEKIARAGQSQNSWLEPMRKWVTRAADMEKIALDCNLIAKRVAAKEIFGSNLLLHDKMVEVKEPNYVANTGESIWRILSASREKMGFPSERLKLEPPPRFELGTSTLQKWRSTN